MRSGANGVSPEECRKGSNRQRGGIAMPDAKLNPQPEPPSIFLIIVFIIQFLLSLFGGGGFMNLG